MATAEQTKPTPKLERFEPLGDPEFPEFCLDQSFVPFEVAWPVIEREFFKRLLGFVEFGHPKLGLIVFSNLHSLLMKVTVQRDKGGDQNHFAEMLYAGYSDGVHRYLTAVLGDVSALEMKDWMVRWDRFQTYATNCGKYWAAVDKHFATSDGKTTIPAPVADKPYIIFKELAFEPFKLAITKFFVARIINGTEKDLGDSAAQQKGLEALSNLANSLAQAYLNNKPSTFKFDDAIKGLAPDFVLAMRGLRALNECCVKFIGDQRIAHMESELNKMAEAQLHRLQNAQSIPMQTFSGGGSGGGGRGHADPDSDGFGLDGKRGGGGGGRSRYRHGGHGGPDDLMLGGRRGQRHGVGFDARYDHPAGGAYGGEYEGDYYGPARPAFMPSGYDEDAALQAALLASQQETTPEAQLAASMSLGGSSARKPLPTGGSGSSGSSSSGGSGGSGGSTAPAAMRAKAVAAAQVELPLALDDPFDATGGKAASAESERERKEREAKAAERKDREAKQSAHAKSGGGGGSPSSGGRAYGDTTYTGYGLASGDAYSSYSDLSAGDVTSYSATPAKDSKDAKDGKDSKASAPAAAAAGASDAKEKDQKHAPAAAVAAAAASSSSPASGSSTAAPASGASPAAASGGAAASGAPAAAASPSSTASGGDAAGKPDAAPTQAASGSASASGSGSGSSPAKATTPKDKPDAKEDDFELETPAMAKLRREMEKLQRQQAAMSQFGAVALLKASFLKGALTLDAFKEQLAAQHKKLDEATQGAVAYTYSA